LNKMKSFLKNSFVIQSGATLPERELILDVFGELNSDNITAKIVEVAMVK